MNSGVFDGTMSVLVGINLLCLLSRYKNFCDQKLQIKMIFALF